MATVNEVIKHLDIEYIYYDSIGVWSSDLQYIYFENKYNELFRIKIKVNRKYLSTYEDQIRWVNTWLNINGDNDITDFKISKLYIDTAILRSKGINVYDSNGRRRCLNKKLSEKIGDGILEVLYIC